MNTWDKMSDIKENLLRGIMSIGFETPSPIQEQSISKIANGDNIIAQAQSGTGKTGAFVIGTLNAKRTKDNPKNTTPPVHSNRPSRGPSPWQRLPKVVK